MRARRCVQVAMWLMAITVLPTASAAAQTTADYPGGPTVEVQGESFTRGEATGGGETAVSPGSAVGGTQASRSGGLAVTGSDIVQLGVLGGVLVAGGTVFVRRSRRRDQAGPALTAS